LGTLLTNIGYLFLAIWRDELYLGGSLAGIVFSIVVIALVLIFGWWKADNIGRLMAGDMDDDKLVISTSNSELYTVLITFLGIYLLATSIPGLITHLSEAIFFFSSLNNNLVLSEQLSLNKYQILSQFAGQLIALAIGIFLTFQGRTVSGWLTKMWNLGMKPVDEKESNDSQES